MQTKTNLMYETRTSPRSVVAAAKTTPVAGRLTMNAEGDLVVNGTKPSKPIRGVTSLLEQAGELSGEDLRRMAISHFLGGRGGEDQDCIVVENLAGQLKAFTRRGILPIDGMSRDLVSLGCVYRARITDSGFVLIDPDQEIVVADGVEAARRFGRLPRFVFDAVWDRIRTREAAAQAEQRAVQESLAVDARLNGLMESGRMNIGML